MLTTSLLLLLAISDGPPTYGGSAKYDELEIPNTVGRISNRVTKERVFGCMVTFAPEGTTWRTFRELSRSGEDMPTAMTDEAGEFRITLEPATYEVFIYCGEEFQQVTPLQMKLPGKVIARVDPDPDYVPGGSRRRRRE